MSREILNDEELLQYLEEINEEFLEDRIYSLGYVFTMSKTILIDRIGRHDNRQSRTRISCLSRVIS